MTLWRFLALAGLLAACSSSGSSPQAYGPLSAEAQSSSPCTQKCQERGQEGIFMPGRGPGDASCMCVDPVRTAPAASATP